MSIIYRPIILEGDGIFGQLPNNSIINIGGVQNTSGSFTLNGQGILLADGSSTGPGAGITLQSIYDRSSPASIILSTGKDFTIYDDTNNSIFFRIDAETGKITITGDLEVLGASTIIDTIIQDSDHWIISPKTSTTIPLKIEPDIGVTPLVDLVNIRRIHGGQPIFRIDKDGNIISSGLFNNISISQFYNDFISHITNSVSIKHSATEISTNGPFLNIGQPQNVEQALITLDALITHISAPNQNLAGLFFIDVVPTTSGNVGNKLFVPFTVPENRVIAQAVTDTNNITVILFVEPNASFYSPTVTITTNPPQLAGPISAILIEDNFDKRAFTAMAQLSNITTHTTVTATSSTGATAILNIVRAPAGPSFNSLLIGPYPGTQTSVKAGDVITISGVVENSAEYAELIVGGANSQLVVLTLGSNNSASQGFKTVSGTFVVSNLSGIQNVTARARNLFNTFGENFNSNNSIVLDQTFPIIGPTTITYPLGQFALKHNETAAVSTEITNFDIVNYSGNNISILNPNTYSISKTVMRIGGTYSFNVNNFTITAIRLSNNAITTSSSAINIAHTPPTVSIFILGNPARLQSSPSGINYTVVLTADQRLLNAPNLQASSGTWIGAWTGSGTTWQRTLRISDNDPKGPQQFSNLVATGLANVIGNIITAGANYIVGGFLTRTIIFPAFARWASIGTAVVDFNKVSARYTDGASLTRFNDTQNRFQGFTIVDSLGNFLPTGEYLFISDEVFAGANTTGTLQLDIMEII